MRYYFCTLLVLFLNACKNNLEEGVTSQKIVTSEYLKSKVLLNDNTNSIEFRMVSNPYKWDSGMKLILYINNKIVYLDKFSMSGVMKTILFENRDLIHLRMEIIKNDNLVVLENKSVFYWDNNYKYIYIGLFPDNPHTDMVQFFPQKDLIIQ